MISCKPETQEASNILTTAQETLYPLTPTPTNDNIPLSETIPNFELNITYYWKILVKDDKGGETSSPVWSFTIKGE